MSILGAVLKVVVPVANIVGTLAGQILPSAKSERIAKTGLILAGGRPVLPIASYGGMIEFIVREGKKIAAQNQLNEPVAMTLQKTFQYWTAGENGKDVLREASEGVVVKVPARDDVDVSDLMGIFGEGTMVATVLDASGVALRFKSDSTKYAKASAFYPYVNSPSIALFSNYLVITRIDKGSKATDAWWEVRSGAKIQLMETSYVGASGTETAVVSDLSGEYREAQGTESLPTELNALPYVYLIPMPNAVDALGPLTNLSISVVAEDGLFDRFCL